MNEKKLPVGFIATPRILQFLLWGTMAAALVFYLNASAVVSKARRSTRTIGAESVPSIAAASEIRVALSDAIASAAVGSLATGSPAREAWDRYDKAMSIAGEHLVAAAANIKAEHRDEDQQPILTIVQAMPRVTALIALARETGGPGGTAKIREAAAVVEREMLPAADALEQVNVRHLADEYDVSKSDTLANSVELTVTGLLLASVLLGTQIFLAGRFRRIVNPALLGSMALLVVMGLWLLYALSATQGWLKIAKEDSFDSIHALWRARATARDANVDQLLWLTDSGSTDLDTRFKRQKAMLADVTLDEPFLARLNMDSKISFRGLLGDELRNVTFSGEREEAISMIKWYAAYLEIDQRIRALQVSGKHGDAVALSIGTREPEAGWAFENFDKVLLRIVAINQKEFDSAMAEANDQFVSFSWILATGVIGIVLLAWLGLRPRMREYA